jgi:hypothetical protein
MLWIFTRCPELIHPEIPGTPQISSTSNIASYFRNWSLAGPCSQRAALSVQCPTAAMIWQAKPARAAPGPSLAHEPSLLAKLLNVGPPTRGLTVSMLPSPRGPGPAAARLRPEVLFTGRRRLT